MYMQYVRYVHVYMLNEWEINLNAMDAGSKFGLINTTTNTSLSIADSTI